VIAFLDLDRLTARLHAESAEHGVSAEASGHHAGELETSILAAIRPRAVRRTELAIGFVEPASDPQRLFYPSLRDRVASGTVGDPRGASADRAARYLDAWVDLLVESYLRAKNEK
jgi:creatinine amidohydrolase/Fe(II)-dependent formamide hydrolase-like protein